MDEKGREGWRGGVVGVGQSEQALRMALYLWSSDDEDEKGVIPADRRKPEGICEIVEREIK